MKPESELARADRVDTERVDTERVDVVVVGAGIAGLVAATELASRPEAPSTIVLDKGRGVGGRMATRRIGDATFDHGAPCFEAVNEPARSLATDLSASGVISPWPIKPTRWRGVPSMTAIAKRLATGLDVRTGWRVGSIRLDGGRWLVSPNAESGRRSNSQSISAAALIITCPVPQCLDLLDAARVPISGPDRDALRAISYDPCLVVLAAFDRLSGLVAPDWTAPTGDRLGRGRLERVIDQQRLGVSSVPAAVLHSSADYSRDRWSMADQQIVDELLSAARAEAGLEAELVANVSGAHVQRWRFARAVTRFPQPMLIVSGAPMLVIAGDGFGPGDVDGAGASGRAAAQAVMPAVMT